MTDTERIKMALPLLQALADGKQLQFRMPNDEWRAMELDCDAVLDQPTSYRIAPDLPPKPPQEWMDKHGVEIDGDSPRRIEKDGEIFAPIVFDYPPIIRTAERYEEKSLFGGCRWILRKIAKPKPRYEPWDFQTVPMPLPVIFRGGTGYQIVAVFPVGFATIGGQQRGWKPDIHAWNDLQHYAQRDGLPCGRRVEP